MCNHCHIHNIFHFRSVHHLSFQVLFLFTNMHNLSIFLLSHIPALSPTYLSSATFTVTLQTCTLSPSLSVSLSLFSLVHHFTLFYCGRHLALSLSLYFSLSLSLFLFLFLYLSLYFMRIQPIMICCTRLTIQFNTFLKYHKTS